VVVFDKVNENTRTIIASSEQTYTQATNLAVNQTIVRSINTTVTSLLPVASILIIGGALLGAGTLKDIALALFIGMLVGAYSSIFIAPAILAQLREKEPAMIALAARVNARGGAPVTANSAMATHSPKVAVSEKNRGPRNQPKRKNRK
jgi:preprotein translocase subunit SecF